MGADPNLDLRSSALLVRYRIAGSVLIDAIARQAMVSEVFTATPEMLISITGVGAIRDKSILMYRVFYVWHHLGFTCLSEFHP